MAQEESEVKSEGTEPKFAKGDKHKKKRLWRFLVYPDSAPENWREILRETCLEGFISPKHDRDLEKDGVTIKKAHWHCFLIYEGPTSFECVKEITDAVGGPRPEAASSIKGNYAYFTHKYETDPHKAKYDEGEMELLNGFDPSNYFEQTFKEAAAKRAELLEFVVENDIRRLWDLTLVLHKSGAIEDSEVVYRDSAYFDRLLRSRFLGKRDAEAYSGCVDPTKGACDDQS